MATAERVEVRMDSDLVATTDKAATISGKNRSDFIRDLIKENAPKVIEEYASFTLKNDIFDNFISACENAAAPNQSLQKASKLAKEHGIA